MLKNGLIRKIRLISKCMKSQPGKQIIAIHILPNISISKNNQTMKFGHENFFLRKSFKKHGGETIPRSVSKKSELKIVCFYCIPS